MEIGLINPNKNLKDAAVHLGLGYLSSYAKSQHNNLNIRLLDTRISSKRQIKRFTSCKYDLIGITSSSQTFSEAVNIASEIKDIYPETPICIGGAHASTYKKEAIQNFPFDFAVVGEGEKTFSDLILYLQKKLDINQINGLIYKDIKDNIISNPPRELISNPDTIPVPDYHIFRMSAYPQHRMVTSRGCPFDCVFCNSKAIWTRKWRKRSPENLIEEIIFLQKNFGNKTFVFNDDSFNIDSKRVLDFCDALLDKKINLLWSASARVDLITEAMADALKAAGCYDLSIGIESANNSVLEKINKNISREKILVGIKTLRSAGIDVLGQFMIGNPGDTLETIKESVEFAESSGLTGVEFYTALPYKGSALYDFVQKHGTMLTETEAYNYHLLSPRIIFETPEFPNKDILEAIRLVQEKSFYNALNKDRRIRMLDMGRKLTNIIRTLAGPGKGNSIFLRLRKIYHSIS